MKATNKPTFNHAKIKWPMVKLGEIAEVISGQSPESKYYNKKGEGLPFYQGKTEFSDMYLSKPVIWTSKTTKIAQQNDILMSVRAPVGPVNISTEKICIGRGLATIQAKNKINMKFLFYFLKSISNQIRGVGGSVFDSINQKKIKQIKIPLPPLSEQKRIAEIISTWDQAIEKLDKLISAKEKQFKWLLKKLITDQKNNPKWKKVRLEQIAYIKKGQQLNRITLSKVGDYPVQNGGVEPSGYTDKWNTKENTITISEGGNSCGFVKFNDRKFWSGGHCYFLTNVSNKLDKKFLFHYLKNYEQKIMRLRVGSGLPNIQRKDIKNFLIIYPDLKIQKQVSNVLDHKEIEIKTLKQLTIKYQEQKKGLMQQLLTGKIRVWK